MQDERNATDEGQDSSEALIGIVGNPEEQYLLFEIDNELFGTPLLQVREIVEPIPYRHVPNTVDKFIGIVNLRGEIVGVCDPSGRYSYEKQHPDSMRLLVFEAEAGPLAALVDNIVTVTSIVEERIERNPPIKSRFPGQNLLGVTYQKERLIILVDLKQLLTDADLISIKNATLRQSDKASA